MASELHSVTVAVRGNDEDKDVRFTCTGTRESECHIYPDGEEWHEGDRQERVAHDECWLQGWFDNDAYSYYGSDALNDGGEAGVPPVARSGPIEFEYEQGCGPTWWWTAGRVLAGKESDR